jgi:inner membrane protein
MAGSTPFVAAWPRPAAANWGGKAILVLGLALLMAIPCLFVLGLVADRQHRAEGVTEEISALQGGPQELLGPVIVAPYTAPRPPAPDSSGKLQLQPPESGWYVVSPETGQVSLSLSTASLRRGIFEVPVYAADAVIDAHFDAPPADLRLPAGASVDWAAARLVVGFSDLRGAKSDVDGVVTTAQGRASVAFSPASEISLGSPGVAPSANVESRVRAATDPKSYGLVAAPASAILGGKGGGVRMRLRFTGAERLSVMPFAKSTTVRAAGDWGAPSFDGGFLPDTRQLTSGGFSAAWNVPFIARGLSDHGASDVLSLAQLGAKDVGVSLVPATDPYQTVTRSLKYAVMFVGLVFLTFFVFEALSGTRVHPAQYLLVGLAQMAFYLLLLSVSEYAGFDLAFGVAALATVLLIGLYAGAAFKSRARGAQALVVFSAVYGLIYLLMRLEDYALLAGSVASFLGLTGAMYLTRNLDWYSAKAPAAPADSASA